MSTTQRSGGAAPYGYQRNEQGGFEPDPDEAPVRKLIFELFLQHKRKLTVAKELNKKGFRTRSGAKFSDSSIDRFLRDPIVVGHHKDNFVSGSGQKQLAVLKPESEWRYPPLEPIIDKSVWQQAQDVLCGQQKKRIAKKPASLFGEYLYCDCGAKMHRPHGRRSYQCSQCENAIEAETLDKIFGKKLEEFSISKNLIERIFSKNSDSEEQKAQREILQKRKKQIEDELEKLYDLFISSAISKARFEQKNKSLEDQLSTMSATISETKESAYLNEIEKLAQTGNVGELWSKLPTDKKRLVVEFYTQRIDVGATNINIALLYPPS